jgi:hypothetical protein
MFDKKAGPECFFKQRTRTPYHRTTRWRARLRLQYDSTFNKLKVFVWQENA